MSGPAVDLFAGAFVNDSNRLALGRQLSKVLVSAIAVHHVALEAPFLTATVCFFFCISSVNIGSV